MIFKKVLKIYFNSKQSDYKAVKFSFFSFVQ